MGLATVVAQEWYSHTYGAWMPMWLGPDQPIVETPFVPFAICDFASAAIERLAILTAAAGLKCGDPTARELAAGAIGLGGALPEMAAVTEMLADLRTLTATMNSPVPAHYLLGAVRRQIRAERVQPSQERTVELESDLAEALCGTVGIDVQEYLDHLRAAGKRKDRDRPHDGSVAGRSHEAGTRRRTIPAPSLPSETAQGTGHRHPGAADVRAWVRHWCYGPVNLVLHTRHVQGIRLASPECAAAPLNFFFLDRCFKATRIGGRIADLAMEIENAAENSSRWVAGM